MRCDRRQLICCGKQTREIFGIVIDRSGQYRHLLLGRIVHTLEQVINKFCHGLGVVSRCLNPVGLTGGVTTRQFLGIDNLTGVKNCKALNEITKLTNVALPFTLAQLRQRIPRQADCLTVLLLLQINKALS